MPKKRSPHVRRLADMARDAIINALFRCESPRVSQLLDDVVQESLDNGDTPQQGYARLISAVTPLANPMAREVADLLEDTATRDAMRGYWLLLAARDYDKLEPDKKARFRDQLTEIFSPQLPEITDEELGNLLAEARKIFDRQQERIREAWAVRDRVAGCLLPRVRAILDQVEQLVGFEREQFYLALMDLPDFFVEEPIRGAKHRTDIPDARMVSRYDEYTHAPHGQDAEDITALCARFVIRRLQEELDRRTKPPANPDRDREIVRLRDVDGLTFGQIAGKFDDLSRSGAEKAYKREKARLATGG